VAPNSPDLHPLDYTTCRSILRVFAPWRGGIRCTAGVKLGVEKSTSNFIGGVRAPKLKISSNFGILLKKKRIFKRLYLNFLFECSEQV